MNKNLTSRAHRAVAPIGVCLCAVALCGCANVSHMLLYTDTSLGIKGGLNPETNTVSMHVGFRRNFATIVPKVQEVENGKPTGEMEAASVYSTSKMALHGLHVPDVEEMVVTGDAADALGQSSAALDPFTSKPKKDNGDSQ
jgi:hypothetical protein